MLVIETVAELQAQSRDWRRDGDGIGFVPTMGALHEGHLSLVEAARRDNTRVIVSVFVNPTQFNDKSDLAAYPRDFNRDAAMLDEAGVDAVFHPGVDEMYPSGLLATRLAAPPLAEVLEGEHRPGHFDGVLTVVARLFNTAIPDRAYFGEKDAQQLAMVRAMVADLAFPLEVVGCPTLRETDGLAMSSRNTRLGPADREHALALVRALGETQRRFAAGERDATALASAVLRVLEDEPGVAVDYAVIVNADSFAPPVDADARSLALIAARVGDVRLIDNSRVGGADLIHFAAERSTPAADPQGVFA